MVKDSAQSAARSASKQSAPALSSSYLEILQFDPKLLFSLPGRYLKNIRLMLILMISVILIGVFSYVSLPRTLNPEVKIPYIIITAALPGAGPKDVEQLITIPLEKEIKSVKGVDTYNSSSQDSVSVIVVEFTTDYEPTQARDAVQAAVDTVTDLPNDAITPQVVDLDFENIPVLEFVLMNKTNANDFASLMRLSKEFKDHLEELSTVDRVEMGGLDKREIHIEIQAAVIQEKDINPFQVADAIKAAISSYPAGTVLTDTANFSMTIDQPVASLQELRELNISLEEQDYLLGDLAIVAERSQYDQAVGFYTDQASGTQQAVSLSVYKTRTAHIDKAGQEIRTLLDEIMPDYQDNYQLSIIQDYDQVIQKQFADLGDNFFQTLLLVFASMFLLYGVRQALIASVAIPIALLIVFIVMQVHGISLSFVSIFALLIALGLFVDNAVVIIEAFTSYYRTGKFSPLETAILVWKDFFVELFSINLLTVWAFLPLLITSGIMGEFIYPLPIIVSASMMGSVAVAVLFTLPSMMILTYSRMPKRVAVLFKILLTMLAAIFLLALYFGITQLNLATVFSGLSVAVASQDYSTIVQQLLPLLLFLLYIFALLLCYRYRKLFTQAGQKTISSRKRLQQISKIVSRAFNQGFLSLDGLSRRYRKIVAYLLNSRSARIKTLVIIIIFSVFSYLLLPLGFVVNEFFPKTDQNFVHLTIDLPSGTNKRVTTAQTLEVLEQIKDHDQVDFYIARVGAAASSGFDIGASGSNNALITVKLKDKDERSKTSIEIAQEFRNEFANFSAGEVKINEDSGGPPAGADLQITILGEDLDQLQYYAQDVSQFMENLEGTTNVTTSIKTGTSKLVFEAKAAKLREYGLKESEIGFWMRMLASGFTIDDLTIDGEDYDMILKMTDSLVSPEEVSLLSIPIYDKETNYVPVNELGSFVLKANPTLISRSDGKRSITITAATLPGYKPTQLNKEVEQFANGELNLASGYQWETGGVNEENQKSIESVLQAMVISAILILATMVTQLGSFRKALIVMLVIPLATSGVFVIFALTGIPLSFPALIGMLSLFGIVIANSLMIVGKVNQNIAAGLEMKEAIIDACASRLEPIALTTASQVIGLLPITLSDPMWQGMGGAIIAGMTFSGTIMLFFIPVVYYYFFPQPAEAS